MITPAKSLLNEIYDSHRSQARDISRGSRHILPTRLLYTYYHSSFALLITVFHL